MGKMDKIVIEHFLAGRLPPELRGNLEADQKVTVTVEAEPHGEKRNLLHLLGSGRGVYSEEEAVSYIRRLRDE